MSVMAYPFFDEYCLSVMLFVSIFFFSSLLTLAQNEKKKSQASCQGVILP